jgi:hypothetical protein
VLVVCHALASCFCVKATLLCSRKAALIALSPRAWVGRVIALREPDPTEGVSRARVDECFVLLELCRRSTAVETETTGENTALGNVPHLNHVGEPVNGARRPGWARAPLHDSPSSVGPDLPKAAEVDGGIPANLGGDPPRPIPVLTGAIALRAAARSASIAGVNVTPWELRSSIIARSRAVPSEWLDVPV